MSHRLSERSGSSVDPHECEECSGHEPVAEPGFVDTVRGEGRSLARPRSLLATGVRLPEFRWAAVATVLFLVGWVAQLAGSPSWLWWGLYLACYVTGGWEPALEGLQALRERRLDVDLLMIVAAVAAASIGQVFDGGLLIVIFATSGAVEAIITQRTEDAVRSLLNLAPEQAELVEADGTSRLVETEHLCVGDVILARPGERIGADGIVVEGVSEVDQQAVTGESRPLRRDIGDEVLSGTMNGTGVLKVRVTRPTEESVVARIVAMVEEASATKAHRQLFIERVEQRYSVGVIILTLAVWGVPFLLFGVGFEEALLRAITVMIVASPCAVMLSTMPPLLAAMANAGRQGVLVKSATTMEQLGRTTIVAFDKTGTLTEGAPEVTDITPTAGQSPDRVLQLAAAVEQHSEHPLGRAISHSATARGIDVPDSTDFRAMPGVGVRAVVESTTVTVERSANGNDAIGTVVSVTVDNKTVGTITLVDRIRPETASTLRRLASVAPAPTFLLTGDNRNAAAHVAEQAGVGEVRANLLPDDKARIVTELEAGGDHVLFVGDGINDAPALASATVGVAMGRHGADLALDTADVVIVRDELQTIPPLVTLARRARRVMTANLAIAGLFITGLIAWSLLGTLPLPLAVAGHEGSTVIVALNGLRLLRRH